MKPYQIILEIIQWWVALTIFIVVWFCEFVPYETRAFLRWFTIDMGSAALMVYILINKQKLESYNVVQTLIDKIVQQKEQRADREFGVIL